MRNIVEYINESSQNSLINYINEEYLINEGLFSWLKKMWNKMFTDTKSNIDKNNGEYVINADDMKNIEDEHEIEIVDMNEKMFSKFIQQTKSDKKNGPFYDAYLKHKDNPKQSILAINIVVGEEKNVIGFRFIEVYKNDENNKIAEPKELSLINTLQDNKGKPKLDKKLLTEINKKIEETINKRKGVKLKTNNED